MKTLSPRLTALLADLSIGNLVRVKVRGADAGWRLPDLFGGGRIHMRATVFAAERRGWVRIVGRGDLVRPTRRGEAAARLLLAERNEAARRPAGPLEHRP